MIEDLFARLEQPARVYRKGPRSTVRLLRDPRLGLLRFASWAFVAFAVVAFIDVAANRGGVSINWMMGWLVLAGGAHILAKRELSAGRHALLTLWRARDDGQPARFSLQLDGARVAEGELGWQQFRICQVAGAANSFLQPKLAYWVVFTHPLACIEPFSRKVLDEGVDCEYLLVERCLHTEDAIRLLADLQNAVGVPDQVDSEARLWPQVSWLD